MARRPDTRISAHAAALAGACLFHAGLVLWLLRTGGDHRGSAAAHDSPLQVTWIASTPAATPAPPVVAVAPHAPPAPPSSHRPRIDPPVQIGPDPPPAASRTLSAVFLEQGKAIARAQSEIDFTRNPLTAKPKTLDVAPSRFRTREPVSVASIANGIGQLFGGPGYTTDPCPRINENIAALGTGGDSELLQEEFRRHKQFCQ